MKINKPYNITGTHQLGKAASKGGRDSAVVSSTSSESGLKLSGSASFIQSMREAVDSSSIRTEVVAQAKDDIENQTVGSETDYNQSITALLVEL